MASNNLTMSLNLDPSNYLKRMQEVLGTTSARTKEGVTVALHLGLNKKEIYYKNRRPFKYLRKL